MAVIHLLRLQGIGVGASKLVILVIKQAREHLIGRPLVLNQPIRCNGNASNDVPNPATERSHAQTGISASMTSVTNRS
jgi:hypothetical protein